MRFEGGKELTFDSVNLYTILVPYIPLLNHSTHSLLDSSLSIDALIQSAVDWRLPASSPGDARREAGS